MSESGEPLSSAPTPADTPEVLSPTRVGPPGSNPSLDPEPAGSKPAPSPDNSDSWRTVPAPGPAGEVPEIDTRMSGLSRVVVRPAAAPAPTPVQAGRYR